MPTRLDGEDDGIFEPDARGDVFVPQTHPPDSPEGMRLSLSWGLIGTGRIWRRLLDEKLRYSNQTQPRWRVLAWARLRPGIAQTELAARLGISGPTLVRILDNLARQKLIERRESTVDRRVKEIYLTETAHPIVAQISKDVALIRHALLQDISIEEMRICLSVLDRIRARVAQVGERPISAGGGADD